MQANRRTSLFAKIRFAILGTAALCSAILASLSGARADERSEPPLSLSHNGKTEYAIVLGHDAIESERNAAQELQKYLEKVTGAVFPLADELTAKEGTPKIFVGPSAAAVNLSGTVAWRALGTDGIVIKTAGRHLVLAGGRPRGTLFAVYTFLQDQVGCRWYADDAPEVVPRRPTLDLKTQNLVYRPPFDMRYLYTGAQRTGDAKDPLFSAKLRQNGSIPEQFGGSVGYGDAHTMLTWVLPPKEHFQEHPDWYALDESGKRVQGNLCYTSEGAMKKAAERVLERVRRERPKWKYAPQKIVSVSPPDSGFHCRCEKCRAALMREGSDSGALIGFVNNVAEHVQKEFPDALISTLAYWNTAAPPRTVRPRGNVLVHFGISNEASHPADQRDRIVVRNFRLPFSEVSVFSQHLVEWGRIASHLYVWDYDTNFTNMIQPHPTYFSFPASLRFYRDQGVAGIFSQGGWSNAGDFVRMKYWVNSQMMWNPDHDLRALVKEFLDAYYGAAAPHLMAYLELVSDVKLPALRPYSCSTRGWLGLAELNRATELFRHALEAVSRDEALSYRVRRERLGIDIVWLQEYRFLRRAARQQRLPFLGPDDPYAEVERIARDEFRAGTYFEWGDFSEHIALLRQLFPRREGNPPMECRRLKPYQWVDIQEALLKSSPADGSEVVDDPKASNRRALNLKTAGQATEAYYELPAAAVRGATTAPADLGGRWRIYAVVRVDPTREPASIACGLSEAEREAYRKVVDAECPAGTPSEYQTVDLGVHELATGTRVFVRRHAADRGKAPPVYVDRLFLIEAE